jgi:hypothetical protein
MKTLIYIALFLTAVPALADAKLYFYCDSAVWHERQGPLNPGDIVISSEPGPWFDVEYSADTDFSRTATQGALSFTGTATPAPDSSASAPIARVSLEIGDAAAGADLAVDERVSLSKRLPETVDANGVHWANKYAAFCAFMSIP